MSNAVTITRPGADKKPTKAEKLAQAEALAIPAALLLAAEATSYREKLPRPDIASIFVHSHNGVGRVVATDSKRMFIASFPLPEDSVPKWLARGVVISNEGLRARIGLIDKISDTASVRVSYAIGLPNVELSDERRSAMFTVPAVDAEFPDYEHIVGADTFGKLNEDGTISGREWEPIGINSQYLKHCGDIARVLDAGLPKEQRSKSGMVVRAFGGNDETPMVFDFSSWPGALLIMMPAKLATKEISGETAAILAPAVRASIAALRAHSTRWMQRVEQASSEAEKEGYREKARQFLERIGELSKRLPNVVAIEAEPVTTEAESKPEAEAKPEADERGESEAKSEADEKPADEPTATHARGPEIKRTRVKFNRKAA